MDYGCVCCLFAPVLWSCLDLKSIVCGLSHGTSSAIAIAIANAVSWPQKKFLAMGELGVIVLHLHPSDKWHEQLLWTKGSTAGCFCRIASPVWSLNFAHDQITVIVLFLNLPVTGWVSTCPTVRLTYNRGNCLWSRMKKWEDTMELCNIVTPLHS